MVTELSEKEAGEKSRELEDECEGQKQQRKETRMHWKRVLEEGKL